MPVHLSLLFSIFLALDCVCWAWMDRLLRQGGAHKGFRIGLAVFMAFQIAALLIVQGSILINHTPPPAIQLGKIPGSLFFLWHFLALPVTATVLAGFRVVEMFRGSAPAPKPVTASKGAATARKAEPHRAGLPVNRRQFLGLAGPAATLVATGVALPQLSRFRIRELTVEVTGLPPSLDGLRIAHVSDLHVGRLTHGDVLDDLVEQTNSLKADLVLVTGDLIDYYLTDLPLALDTVGRLEGKYGVFVSEGNHDLFESPERFRADCRKAPGAVSYLFHEDKTIRIGDQPVQIFGLRWCGPDEEWIKNSVLEMAERRNPAAFPILMAHHPHAFDTAAQEGFPLTLAGHTHGGQLMLTETIGWGPVMFRYWSGLYRKDRARLVVSNGVGNWFPLRVGAEAEVIHLTLRAV